MQQLNNCIPLYRELKYPPTRCHVTYLPIHFPSHDDVIKTKYRKEWRYDIQVCQGGLFTSTLYILWSSNLFNPFGPNWQVYSSRCRQTRGRNISQNYLKTLKRVKINSKWPPPEQPLLAPQPHPSKKSK